MKGVDIFCTSHAATSICLSMDPNSSSSPSSATLLGGGGGSGRAIDRHNPIIKDSKRAPKPTSSLPPTTSKKKRNPPIPPNQNENHPNIDDANPPTAIVKKSWSCTTNPGDFLSPPASTRYLLREKAQYNTMSDSVEESSDKDVKTEELHPVPSQQVVVLRVSLHCRGCERKLRKHLSRMEGVTSFDIDFAAKKVTVAGKVTPLDVVSSISKVKNAQLWSPAISSSSEMKNHDSKLVVA